MNFVEGYCRLGQHDTSEGIKLAPAIRIMRMAGKLPAPQELYCIVDFVARHRTMGFRAHICLESCPRRLIIAGMQLRKRMMPREMTPQSGFPRRSSEERLNQI